MDPSWPGGLVSAHCQGLVENSHTAERASGRAIPQLAHTTSLLEHLHQDQQQQQCQPCSELGYNGARSGSSSSIITSSSSSSSASLDHLSPLADEALQPLGGSSCARPSSWCPTLAHSHTSSSTTTTTKTTTKTTTTDTRTSTSIPASTSDDIKRSTCSNQQDDNSVIRAGVKCLVTGGSGYVGLHLACSLVARGHSVVLFDLRPPSSLPPGCEGVGSSSSSSKEGTAAAAAAGGVDLPSACTFVQGDLCDYAAVAAACAGVHSIFHVASYGMSGAESLRTDVIERVNVGGTSNLLRAAAEAGVRRFVHVSSYNAIWVRQTVRGGDEASSPYLPYECYPDAYSRTKSMAERMVLEANGTPTAAAAAATCGGCLCCCSQPPSSSSFPSTSPSSSCSSSCKEHCCSHGDSPTSPFTTTCGGHPTGGQQIDPRAPPRQLTSSTATATTMSNLYCSDGAGGRPRLLTCAVRPPAIYGPGELRHTPRILSYARAGLLCFAFGSPESKTDWIHVRNLATALLAAWDGLGCARRHAAAGQAYFVSDGQPLNSFAFFEPLLRGLGYTPPAVWVPLQPVVAAAAAMVAAYSVLAALAAAAAAAARAQEEADGGAGGAGTGGGGRVPPQATRSLASGLAAAAAAMEPWMTPAEVYKTAVDHWYSPDKARRELGWAPQQYDFQEVVESYRSFARPRAFAAGATAAATTAAGNPCATALPTPPADAHADADAFAVQEMITMAAPATAAAGNAPPLPPVGVQTCARVLTLGTLWVRLWGSRAPGDAAASSSPPPVWAAAPLPTIRELGDTQGDGDGAEMCSEGSVGWVRWDSSSGGGSTSGSSSDGCGKGRGPPSRSPSGLSTGSASSSVDSSSMASIGCGVRSGGSGGAVGHGRRSERMGAGTGVGVGGVGQVHLGRGEKTECRDVESADVRQRNQLQQRMAVLLAILVCAAAMLLGLSTAHGAVGASAWISPGQLIGDGV